MYIQEYTLSGATATIPIIVDAAKTIKFEIIQSAANEVVVECQLTKDAPWRILGAFDSKEIKVVNAITIAGIYEVDIEDYEACRFRISTFIGDSTHIIAKVI